MLKTLKWVYELGYKHAEAKYYHALMEHLKTKDENDLLMAGFEKETKYRKEEIMRDLDINRRLEQLIGNVFHPIEYLDEPVRKVNRFEP